MKNTRHCPSCEGRGTHFAQFKFWADYQFELQWCESCDNGWVPQLPEPAVFSDAYERLNSLNWHQPSPPAITKAIRRAYLKGFRTGTTANSLFAKRPKRPRVLEIGSNIGVVLKGVQDALGIAPTDTLGIDFSRNHADVSREKFGIPTLVGTLDQVADQIDGHFDLIVCHHIIEHDDTPGAFLNKLVSLLAPGGVISFELPNGKREAECIRQDEKAGLKPYTLINHINYFSPRGFRRFLDRAGVQTKHLSTLNANNVLHDFGWWRDSGEVGAPPRLADHPPNSVIDVFDNEAIQEGIRRASKVRGVYPIIHNYLRVRYPQVLPWGRDIEAWAVKPS